MDFHFSWRSIRRICLEWTSARLLNRSFHWWSGMITRWNDCKVSQLICRQIPRWWIDLINSIRPEHLHLTDSNNFQSFPIISNCQSLRIWLEWSSFSCSHWSTRWFHSQPVGVIKLVQMIGLILIRSLLDWTIPLIYRLIRCCYLYYLTWKLCW